MLIAALSLFAGAPAAHAAVANKFVFTSHFGWEVDQTTGANVCTVASKNTCQPATESSQPGGFRYPKSVAVDNDPSSPYYTDVYVADENNNRVQVLSPTGAFVSMFGWEVNETTKGNICTEEEIMASGVKCKAGVEGSAAGQFGEGDPQSVAIDPASGNVYATDLVFYRDSGGVFTGFGWRVQEFTAEGKFVLEIGKEVNDTTKGNLCTEEEVEKGAKCKGPEEQLFNTPYEWGGEHGAFNLETSRGNLLAVGGPEDLLYVGDEHRVQEFSASTGAWKGEIPLSSISPAPESRVQALAVDEAGDVYLIYNAGPRNTIHVFNPGGVQSGEFEVTPAEANPEREGFSIKTLALDPYGRLGVATQESIFHKTTHQEEQFTRGALYSTAGVRLAEFVPPSGSIPGNPNGLAFSSSDDLYVAGGSSQEVEAYAPALFPEVVTCAASEVSATSARLCGSIDANGSPARGFFAYAPPSGARSPVVFEGEGATPEAVSWLLTGLEPNQTYGYEMVGEAEVAGERATAAGESVSFHTATPPPEVAGVPSASDVTDAFALLTASVNPEHALARYHFQYGPCAALAGCAALASTPVQESSVYGTVGAIQEIVGLQPGTTYSYRLVADNEHEEAGHVLQGGETAGVEGHFTTGASPVPVAQTGLASGVGVGGATISGLADPDGQPAVYVFELGVYEGAGTHYGIVFSGSAGASSTPVAESLPLSGLQPGTIYAYRIVVKSGYGEAVGQTLTFTTEGLPAVLAVPAPLAMLAVPNIAFPREAQSHTTTVKKKASVVKCKRGKKRVRGRCVAAKRKQHAKNARNARKAGRASRSRKAKR
ncbi:MAG TPA: hypothetical protein VIJ66_12130 [Solirubrobacteraceae bacterium]